MGTIKTVSKIIIANNYRFPYVPDNFIKGNLFTVYDSIKQVLFYVHFVDDETDI